MLMHGMSFLQSKMSTQACDLHDLLERKNSTVYFLCTSLEKNWQGFIQ